MGFFSSTREQVANSAIRLLDDKDFRYSSQMAMNDYLFKKADFTGAMIAHANNALPKKLKRAFRIADKPDRYVFGLPKDSILASPRKDVLDATAKHIKQLENAEVTLIQNIVNGKLPNTYVWERLQSIHQYNPKTNQLMVNKEWVYLYDVQIYLTQETAKKYLPVKELKTALGFDYGKTQSRSQDTTKRLKEFGVSTSNKAVVQYTYKDTRSTPAKDAIKSFEMDLSKLAETPKAGAVIKDSKDIVQVIYQVADEVKFFNYEFGSGGVYEIDSSIITDDGVGEYYPRFYTRVDYKDVAESKDERWKKSMKRMFRLLDLTPNKITKQINKAIGDDLADVVYIYFDMSIAINKDTWDTVTGEYLFEYFGQLYELCKPSNETKRKGISQNIADNISHQTVAFDEISKETKQGRAIIQGNKPLKVGNYAVFKDATSHQLVHQISDSRYESIVVKGLRNTHNIYGRQQTIPTDDENLTIPLDKLWVDKLSPKEQEKLMYKALHIQIGVRKEIEVPWYQRGIFKVVMALVGIAIAYFTAGAGASFSTVLFNAATNAVVSYAISLGLDMVLKIAVDLGLSPEVVGVIAFVATIALATNGNVSTMSFKAADVMRAVNQSLDIYNKTAVLKINQINNELREFRAYAKDQEGLLKQQQQMLLTRVIPLDLEALSSPVSQQLMPNYGETPQQFYNRTMTVDVREITLSMASMYVYNTTRLPDYQTSMAMIEQQQQRTNEPVDLSYVLLV